MMNSMPDNSLPGNSKSLPSVPLRRAGSSSEGSRPTVNVVGSLRRHWYVAALVLLVLLACGAFVLWKKAKPEYESHSVVYLSPRFPKMLASDSEVELPYDSYVQDQIQTVTRHDIIADAIAKLPLAVRRRGGLPSSYEGPALPYEIEVLQKKLEVKRLGSTYEMSVALHDAAPNDLAQIVNTVTDTYVERMKSEEFYGLDLRLDTLRQEKVRLQKEMDDGLAEQAQLMQQLGVATLSSKEGATNIYDATLQKLSDELVTARMQRQAAEAQLTAEVKGSGPGGSTVTEANADEAIASDAGLSAVRTSLNSRKTALIEEMNGLRPDHPIYQKDKDELDSIEGQMNDLRRKAGENLQDRLRQEVTRTRMIELQLTQELAQRTHSAASAAPKFQRAAALGPEIDSLQKAYSAIDDRIRDLELESSSPGSIHVSSRALTPLNAEPSKLRIYLLALVLLSLACAVAAPVGIDLLDNRIFTPQDVEQVVGFHPLGVLLDNREFRREIAGEYYLRLAAGIDHAVRSAGARIFLFTSPAHGSGTSTVVRELSDKLRSLDLRTQTIMASASEGLETNPDDTSWRSQLLLQWQNRTDEIRLATIAPITAAHDRMEFRKGQEAPTLNSVVLGLHHVSDQYDVVLIDASPLPISAHTEYLARVSDVTVLVVRSSATTKQELDRAARLLERLDVAGVAVVLNKMSMERADRALKKELHRYEQSFRQRRSTSVKESVRREKVRA
jgi:capsular polysaccharide biosynthesis protein